MYENKQATEEPDDSFLKLFEQKHYYYDFEQQNHCKLNNILIFLFITGCWIRGTDQVKTLEKYTWFQSVICSAKLQRCFDASEISVISCSVRSAAAWEVCRPLKRLGWSLLSCVCPSLLWGRNKSFGTVDQSDFRFKPGSEEMSIKGIGKHPERAVREGELKHVTAEYCIYFWACRSTRGNRQPRLSGERRMMTMTSPPERCVWCRQSEQYVMLAPQWQVHAVSAAADSSWLLELARRPHCVNVQRWHNSRLVRLTALCTPAAVIDESARWFMCRALRHGLHCGAGVELNTLTAAERCLGGLCHSRRSSTPTDEHILYVCGSFSRHKALVGNWYQHLGGKNSINVPLLFEAV